jgi:hypothetical protein
MVAPNAFPTSAIQSTINSVSKVSISIVFLLYRHDLLRKLHSHFRTAYCAFAFFVLTFSDEPKL